MPERAAREEEPTRVELDITRAFGWTIILYEESLYERFLQISSDSSLMGLDEFRGHLREMEAKGYISSISMHGHRAYRKLLFDEDAGVPLTPRVPLEEIRLALGSREARMKRTRDQPKLVTSNIVDESEEVGEYVLDLIENYLKYKYGFKSVRKSVLLGYLEKLSQALGQSEDTFYGFIEKNTPEMLTNLRRIMETRGPDVLLLGLRLVESDMRRYR
ncbi:MAG: hypothetical protein JW779_14210 [Candidatus Thorarchaeota archaeon]|nr:hypothetical protein [Candidatus Thorarchaeota archaeon]